MKKRNQSPALAPSPAKAGEGPRQELAAEAAPTRTFGVVRDDTPQDRNMKPILLDGKSLTQRQLARLAYVTPVELSAHALRVVARSAEFLAAQVSRESLAERRVEKECVITGNDGVSPSTSK